MGPFLAHFCLGPRRCGSYGPIVTPLARTFFARQLVQEENRGHIYHFENLGVLSSVFIRNLDGITVQWRGEGAGEFPGRRARGRIFGAKGNWRNLKFRPSQDLKNGPPIFICLYGLKMGPLGPLFTWALRRCGPHGPIFTPLARTFFARQLVQEENMGHLYNLGNLGVLFSVFIGDLHGITGRGNRGITAVETAVMGNGFSLSRRKRR